MSLPLLTISLSLTLQFFLCVIMKRCNLTGPNLLPWALPSLISTTATNYTPYWTRYCYAKIVLKGFYKVAEYWEPMELVRRENNTMTDGLSLVANFDWVTYFTTFPYAAEKSKTPSVKFFFSKKST